MGRLPDPDRRRERIWNSAGGKSYRACLLYTYKSPQPMVAIQTVLTNDQLAIGNSILAFAMFLGGAVFVSAANNLEDQGLITFLHQLVPNVNPEIIAAAGATGFRKVVSKADLPKVILAYNHALMQTFYISAGSSAAGALAAFGMGWVNLKKIKVQTTAKTETTNPK